MWSHCWQLLLLGHSAALWRSACKAWTVYACISVFVGLGHNRSFFWRHDFRGHSLI
jgi:ADP-heptose:LPS heptosyltransferase